MGSSRFKLNDQDAIWNLPLPILQQLDQLADELESAWHRGERPSISDYADRLCIDDTPTKSLVEGHLTSLLEELSTIAPSISGTPLPIEFASSNGPIMVGEYRLQEPLGSGGMGVVFRATHVRLQRAVAIKFPRLGGWHDSELSARFLREARVIGGLEHRHIVRAFDAGDSSFGPYLVTEFVEGKSIDDIVRSSGPLSISESIELVLQAADALAYAHSKGIVHRDVKPSNLLIDQNNTVRIVDFGLAKPGETSELLSNYDATLTRQFVGTVAYAAPEQLRPGVVVDCRSDIYSLGCVFYYLLTGQSLHSGSLADRLLSEPQSVRTALPTAIPSIPSRIAASWSKMVARRPEDRFSSMHEAADSLRAALAAGPDSRYETRFKRWLVGTGLLLGALLLIGVSIQNDHRQRPFGNSPMHAVAPFSASEAAQLQSVWAAYLQLPKQITNSIGMSFVLIPPGEFEMGAIDPTALTAVDPENWRWQEPDEIHRIHNPQHRVRLTKSLYFGATEVTFQQFSSFVDASGYVTEAEKSSGWGREDRGWLKRSGYSWKNTGQRVSEPDHPVMNVSWNDALAFCDWLNKVDSHGTYRLPTEAEWEFVCRAGTNTVFYFGENADFMREHGWTSEESDGRIQLIATKQPNPFGVYDLYGNRQEWCLDHFDPLYYTKSPIENPLCTLGDGTRVLRGGTHTDPAIFCNSTRRWSQLPDNVGAAGIRVVCETEDPHE